MKSLKEETTLHSIKIEILPDKFRHKQTGIQCQYFTQQTLSYTHSEHTLLTSDQYSLNIKSSPKQKQLKEQFLLPTLQSHSKLG